VTANWPIVQATVETVMNAIGLVVNTVLTAVSAWWTEHGAAVMTIANAAWSAIVAGVTGYVTMMQTNIATVLGVVQALWATWGDTLTALATNTWTAIQAVITTAVTIIQNNIDAFAAALTGDWTTFGEELRANWDAVWGLIGTLAATGAANLLLIVSELVTNIIAAIAGTDWGAVGSGIINSIAAGVSSAASGLVAAAVSAVQAAMSAAQGFVGGGSSGSSGGVSFGGAQADGGEYLVNRPTLFLAGEAGAEVASFQPVARMKNSDIAQANPAGNLTVNVDARGSTLSREEIESIVYGVLKQFLGQQDAAMRLGEA